MVCENPRRDRDAEPLVLGGQGRPATALEDAALLGVLLLFGGAMTLLMTWLICG